MEALAGHSWQGNVRELSNVLERALLAMHGEEIQMADLPFVPRELRLAGGGGRDPADPQYQGADAEKAALLAALKKTGNNKAQAADFAGHPPDPALQEMKKHGLPLQDRDCV